MKASIITSTGSPTAEGSQSGALIVFEAGIEKVTQNTSAEAVEIKSLVEAYVNHPQIS